MRKFLLITFLCFLTIDLIACDDGEKTEEETETEEDNGWDAYNVTLEEKLGFVNRWCTGDKFATGFMKALVTCRDKVLTPEEVKEEEECFSKIFEGRSIKIIHDEEEEKKFVCHEENKAGLIEKYDEVKKCMSKDEEWRINHRANLKKCMKDSTEEMRAMQDVAIDFIERWCAKEEGPMNFMKGYVDCREKIEPKELVEREESCFQKHFGKDVSLKALHEEEAERKMVCGFKDKRIVLRKHHLIWACIKPTPEQMKTYKHDFKECMDKKGLKFGGM